MQQRSVWVAILLAVAFVGAGCSHATNDRQVATSLKAEMYSDPQLKDSSLSITVKQGVATLSGKVPSVAARYEAFKVASETPGVSKVNDRMTVREPAMASHSAANTPPARPTPEPERKLLHRHRAVQPAQPAPAEPQTAQAEPQPASAPNPDETSAARPAPVASAPSPEPPAPPPLVLVTVPRGTRVSVRMIDSIDSSVNRTGDIFRASLAKPIVVSKKVVVPKGANVYLRLVEARSAGHIKGQSELRVELYRLMLKGKSYPLVSNDYEVKGSNRSKRSALAIIGGAVAGAAIGAIAGGGKGAAIGAAAGGGGGAAYEGFTKAKQVNIPSESVLKFRLDQPLDVTFAPAPSAASNPIPNPQL
jgi:hypothetical protein